MKICLICVEIFAWGKYGGFGRSTRMLGRELVKRGYDVTAIVPRREGQKEVENLDGIRVLGFEQNAPLRAMDLFRQADADIYHSQEVSFGTYMAQKAMPERKHLITFRDTRDARDWWIEFSYPSKSRLQVLSNIVYEDNFLTTSAVRRADRLFAAAHLLIPKARKKYRVDKEITFLPSPIPFAKKVEKSANPLVCFVGRLDRRKRPEIFFELAQRFPQVEFAVLGRGQDAAWERSLHRRYDAVTNLKFLGFVDQFDGSDTLSNILGKSWILINTSAREGLPTSFVEAAGHRCAILSEINPDNFASDFGYHVRDGDFEHGLDVLLNADLWREKGERGYEYVANTFSLAASLDRHVEIYRKLLK